MLSALPDWVVTALVCAVLAAIATYIGIKIKNKFWAQVLSVSAIVIGVTILGPYVNSAIAAGPSQAESEAAVLAYSPELYGALKEALPGEFDTMTALYSGIVGSGSSPEFALDQVRNDTSSLRDKYAGIIQSAPDAEISALNAQIIAVHTAVIERGGPELCGLFALDKNVALIQAGVMADYQADADALNAAFFRAAGAATANPVTRDEATQDDQAAFAQALAARQPLPQMMEAISNSDPTNPMLCPGVIEMYNAAADLQGDAGSRLRATLVADYYRL